MTKVFNINTARTLDESLSIITPSVAKEISQKTLTTESLECTLPRITPGKCASIAGAKAQRQ